MLRPAFPGASPVSVETMGRGKANTTLRVTLDDGRSVVLRAYVREPTACAREVALHRFVDARVPVPRILYADAAGVLGGPSYAVLAWVDGVHLDAALAQAREADACGLGRAVGETLAAVSGFRFAGAGFLGPGLTVATPFPSPVAAYLGYSLDALRGRAAGRLGEGAAGRVLGLLERGRDLLAPLEGDRSLVHADYKAPNLLVRRERGAWAVAGVLDWEFAHAGSLVLDMAILFRHMEGEPTPFEHGFVEGYARAGGSLPGEWRRMRRLLDLCNLCGFLDDGEAPPVRTAAIRRLMAASLEDLCPWASS